MIGRIVDLSFGINRKQRLTLEIDGDARELYDQLHEVEKLDIEIKKHRKKRSLSANAYFHVLVNKIARAMGDSDEETKRALVTNYGVYARDDDGLIIGFKLPESVDVSKIYPYTRLYKTVTEGKRKFNCWLVYKSTHEMDTSEMAKLIDGAIEVAKELGIETDTPAQLARYKETWKMKGE